MNLKGWLNLVDRLLILANLSMLLLCKDRYQELQRLTHAKETEDHNSLKMTNFELDRLKVVLDQTKNSLQETRIENEALAAKAKVSIRVYCT